MPRATNLSHKKYIDFKVKSTHFNFCTCSKTRFNSFQRSTFFDLLNLNNIVISYCSDILILSMLRLIQQQRRVQTCTLSEKKLKDLTSREVVLSVQPPLETRDRR